MVVAAMVTPKAKRMKASSMLTVEVNVYLFFQIVVTAVLDHKALLFNRDTLAKNDKEVAILFPCLKWDQLQYN